MNNTKHQKTMEKIIQKIKREHLECYNQYLKLGKELRDYEECNRFIKKNECFVATVNDSSDKIAETYIRVIDTDGGPPIVESFNLKFVFEGKQGIIPNYNFVDINASGFHKKYENCYQRIPKSRENIWVIPLQIPFDWIDEVDE